IDAVAGWFRSGRLCGLPGAGGAMGDSARCNLGPGLTASDFSVVTLYRFPFLSGGDGTYPDAGRLRRGDATRDRLGRLDSRLLRLPALTHACLETRPLKPNPPYIFLGLLAIALLTRTLADRSQRRGPLFLAGYRGVAADFHVHPGFFAAGAVAPWDIGFLAERQGLDALAVTPHNEIFTAKLARWASRVTGGPRILVGEEVRTVVYHLIAVGIHRRVSWNTWNDTVAHVIDDIHSQGGVAIAAHPLAEFWPAFDEQAMFRLDRSKVRHPTAYASARAGPA